MWCSIHSSIPTTASFKENKAAVLVFAWTFSTEGRKNFLIPNLVEFGRHVLFLLLTVTVQTWAYLHAGHAARVAGGGVAEGDVGNELESELPGVQQPHQSLVLLVRFHRLLHHDPRVEDFLQHAGQDPLTHWRLTQTTSTRWTQAQWGRHFLSLCKQTTQAQQFD